MTVSTEINSLLADQLFAIYSHAEMLMMDKVAKRVARGLTGPTWSTEKLADVLSSKAELKAVVDDLTTIASKRVDSAIVDSYLKGVNSAEKDHGLPRTVLRNMEVPGHLQRLVLESNKMIVGTSAQILRDVDDVFRKTQAEAASLVLAGVDTRKQAAQRMLNKFADRGVTSFVDKAGRNWEMASYTEMATRTVTAHAALQGHIDRQAVIGNDLVIVSANGTSCPICQPWAGKVLSITGNTAGYSTVQNARDSGLFHPNCRHIVTAFFPDVPDAPTPDTSAYNPESYEMTQKQRHNERQIRRWKRREVVAMSPQEHQFASGKVREWQAAQRQLLKEYEDKFGIELKRKYDRESIVNRTGKAGSDGSPNWTEFKPRYIAGAKAKAVKKTAVKKEVAKAKEILGFKPEITKPTPIPEGAKQVNTKNIPTLKHLKDRQKKYVEQSFSATADNDPKYDVIKNKLELLAENSVTRTRVSEEVLNYIVADGRFKNQFEVGRSRGTYDPSFRRQASNKLFGTKRGTAKEDYEFYGYLGHKDIVEDIVAAHPRQYGDVVVTLKPHVRERTTFTIDDSLGPATNERMVASLLEDVNPVNLRLRDAEELYNMPVEKMNPVDVVDTCYIRYVEAQYHGGLTIADIESVHIESISLEDIRPSTMEKMKEHGISVHSYNVGDAKWYGTDKEKRRKQIKVTQLDL